MTFDDTDRVRIRERAERARAKDPKTPDRPHRPTWLRLPYRRVWAEDDATCHSSDHVGVSQAWSALYPEELPLKQRNAFAIAKDLDPEGGEDDFLFRVGDRLVVVGFSYPGNSEICEIAAPPGGIDFNDPDYMTKLVALVEVVPAAASVPAGPS